MAELPRGSVTFLFTDIEGSTRLLRELGKRYAEVLTDHRRLLREAFERHRGREVDTQGDSFFVAFGDPGDAVGAAAEAQAALAAHDWPNEVSVGVRMGIHTGEPLIAGEQYVGLDVHRGARIAAAAHGGQVLVSGPTRDLLIADGSATPRCRDLGAHRLKDLLEPERIFQLVIDGLPATFPPLRVHEEAPAAAGLPDYSLPPADVPCPYKGLLPFENEDREIFFGREQLIAELAARLEAASFLAVVGPSGSGKSSLVRAGVVPALEGRAASLRPVVITPGAHPLDELSAADDADVLVVDQFEELFTLYRDEGERGAFIAALLARAERGSRVIPVLRADFYGHCAAYPGLAAALDAQQALVGPMSEEELRRAIELPAERAGLVLEPGLAEAVLRDVVGEPGALPLLSHSLLETWKRRSGRMLTLVGYLHSGGVQGAIAKTAETVYREVFSPEQQVLARNIFLRLTQLGEGTEETRRRVSVSELRPRPEQADAVADVLRVLADARLITIDQETVEVAHEALIRYWPTLRAWLDEDREGRLVHRRLTEAAQEWEALGRDRAVLYRGTRLDGAIDWAVGHDAELNELEREFLAASRTSARRAVRRLRFLLAGALVLVAVTVLGAAIALVQRRHANQAALAEEAQRLGAQALLEPRVDRSLLLAREAVRLDDSAATRADLLAAFLHNPAAIRQLSVPVEQGNSSDLAVSPDGRTLAAASADGIVRFVDTRTRHQAGSAYRFPGGHAILMVSFSPIGRLLAVGGDGSRFTLVDAASHQVRRMFRIPDADLVRRLVFSPDGATLAVGYARRAPGDNGYYMVALYDVASGRRLRPPVNLEGKSPDYNTVDDLAYTPDGRRLLASDWFEGKLVLLDAATLRTVRTYATPGRSFGSSGRVASIAISPDGKTVGLSEDDGSVLFMRLATGSVISRSSQGGGPAAAFTPDGRFVTTSDAGTAIVWDVESATQLQTFLGAGGRVLALSPDGSTLYTGGLVVVAFDLSGQRSFGRTTTFAEPGHTQFENPASGALAVAGDGKTVMLSPEPASVQPWSLQSLRPQGSALARPRPIPRTAGLAPGFVHYLTLDRKARLVAADFGSTAPTVVWNARTGRIVQRVSAGRGAGAGVALRPDGRQLARSDVGHSIMLYDLTRGRSRRLDLQPGHRVLDLAYSPDGSRLVSIDDGDVGTLWDVGRGTVIRRFAAQESNVWAPGVFFGDVAFAGDGSVFATADTTADPYLVRFRNAGDGEPTGGQIPFRGVIGGIALSPDATILAISFQNGIDLWDIPTGTRLGALPATEHSNLAFTPDGEQLVAVGFSGRLTEWSVDPGDWESRACQVAGRNLTRAEWSRYLPDRLYAAICP